MDLLTAYQQSAALKAAIDLDIFTEIAVGNNESESIATRCGGSIRGVRILCDYLVARGLLTKHGATYDLTCESAVFLDRKSSLYLGDAAAFLMAPSITAGYRSLLHAIRRGGTVIAKGGVTGPDHSAWLDFARGMTPLMIPIAERVAALINEELPHATRVLDIGAGHGAFGIAIAQRMVNSEIFALDWPKVLPMALEHARAAAVAPRYHLISGDAFRVDFGQGYDIVLMANFLHHFSSEACISFLHRVRNALAVNGQVVVVEYVLDDDRAGPLECAALSLGLLCTTPFGEAHTWHDYTHMFVEAGFHRNRKIVLSNESEQVLIASL